MQAVRATMAMSDFEFMAQERTLALRKSPGSTPAPRLPQQPDAHSPQRRKRRRVLRFPVQGLRGVPEAEKLRAHGRDFYNVQWRHGGAAMAPGRQEINYGMLYRKPQHECAEKSRESFRAKAAAAQRRLERYDRLVRDRQEGGQLERLPSGGGAGQEHEATATVRHDRARARLP